MADLHIHVGNIKHGDDGEYIGRPMKGRAGSPLANPYRLQSEAQRDTVIDRYRTWLWKKIQASDPKVMAELRRLLDLAKRPEGVTLLCFCAPLACHGDVIASALQWLYEEMQKEGEVLDAARELGAIAADCATGEVLEW